jgi:hypothetical protein
MDPLLCHTVPQVVHLLPRLQCFWLRISMLGLSGLAVVRKLNHPPGMINNYYNHSSMALLFLPFISMLTKSTRISK